MSLLAAFLLAQAPPPPSGRALPPGGVEIPGPIYPAVSRYDSCLRRAILPGQEMDEESAARYRKRVERALAACAETRAAALDEAAGKLERTPGFEDRGKRSLALRHAFEGTDQKWRDLRDIMDKAIREAKARQLAEGMPAINLPREMFPTFGIYLGCVTGEFSRLQRDGATDLADIRARSLAACREVRAAQLARPVELIALSRKRAGPDAARALANRTFDEFDSDYPIERTIIPPPAPEGGPGDG